MLSEIYGRALGVGVRAELDDNVFIPVRQPSLFAVSFFLPVSSRPFGPSRLHPFFGDGPDFLFISHRSHSLREWESTSWLLISESDLRHLVCYMSVCLPNYKLY
jgi:hypothetical protein